MKDAIFQLQSAEGSGFCTGEIVSEKGLLFTNHHCGYESITKHSTTEHNYLDNGFWAKNHGEELSCPWLRVTRVVRIEDVTSRVLNGIDERTKESDRAKQVAKAIAEIEEEATRDNDYEASVEEMYKGGEYYLFVYEAFGDVRLVGAPPSSIGKFGGDTDNWMWPRHTGDFSVFRVYMSPDGKPTKSYDKNNVPYKPLHHLPVSIKGVKEGDFTMIMGYPGSTERFLCSAGMKYKRDYYNPSAVNALGVRLGAMKEDMDENIDIRLALADSYASLANGFKLWGGEVQTLKSTNAIELKEQEEAEFQKWIKEDTRRQEEYGKVLSDLKAAYESFGPATEEMLLISLLLSQGSDHASLALEFMSLNSLLQDEKTNKEGIAAACDEYMAAVPEMFKNYFVGTDKKSFERMLNHYVNTLPAERRNGVFADYIFKNFKGKTEQESIHKFVEAVYTKSIFTDEERMTSFLEKPSGKTLSADPMFAFASGLYGGIFSVQMAYVGPMRKIEVLERTYTKGLREFEKDRVFYPDANSTLRLTYGTVQSYIPRDGVKYKYLTYIDGIIEKEDPSNAEFNVPKELKDLYAKKQFGRYADETGNLPVCFLSDNDITGGNSGSPIINGNGELIGLAFDGNWEWLCSNLIFSPEMQRTINVDARYVLWVIDELYGAKNLIEELDIRK
ncbi:MAG: S46 family peptidase [Bacteroidales bacterium]|nr:S46 family peptidase [Bacteroidales bacterium]